MYRHSMRIISLFIGLTIVSCANKTLTLKTSPSAQVDVLSPDKLDEVGKELGATPVTVNLSDVKGQILRISAKGKRPVFFVVAETAGKVTEASFSLLDESLPVATGSKTESKVTTNRVMRLLLQAYQALSGRSFSVAKELAEQAAKIDPEIAAPQVILGLTFFSEGNLEMAKSALLKAQSLDPEDKNIDVILGEIR